MFVSDNLKEIRNSSEIEKTTDDENKYATKLANQSDVYTVQLTTNYRVYSFVITDATDSFGRAGFYAIRLYTPKKYPLANFHIILQQINKKYLEFDSNGTPKSSQEYDNLLKFDIPLEVKQQDFLHVKSNDNAFCYYDSSNTQLSNIFNAKGIALFNKVYAFNKEKAVDSNLIKSLGLKPLEESKNNFKEVIINNNYRVLKELKVNNNPIEFNSNETDFTVLVNKEDIIEYNTIEEPKFKQDTSLIINVQRKHYAPPPSRPRGQKKPGFWEENGIYLAILLITLILAGGAWHIFKEDEKNENDNNSIIVVEPTNNTTNKTIVDTSKIEFIPDNSIKDSMVFKTLYPKLDTYRFKLDNNKWSYKKGKNKYVDFYKSNLDEIIKIDSLKFNDSLKINFFKNLEKIGGHEILEKEKKIINTPEKKKSETGGTTTKKSSKKEESKKTFQKKEQKSELETDSKSEVKNSKTKKVG